MYAGGREPRCGETRDGGSPGVAHDSMWLSRVLPRCTPWRDRVLRLKQLRDRADSWSTGLVSQLIQPSREKPPLRFLLGEAEGPFVGGLGVRRFPQSPTQIRPRRVRQVIVPQIASREDGVNEGKPRQRAITHRYRDGPIQLDHRRWLRPNQHVVESDDPGPVRAGRTGSLGMHGRDRRLERVRSDSARRQRPFHQRGPLRDLSSVLTDPVRGLENFGELFNKLTNPNGAIKVFCEVANF